MSDLSYRSIGGKQQAPRSLNKGINVFGTVPFELTPPPDKITTEMIMDYQKERGKPYLDTLTNIALKYRPTGIVFDVVDLLLPTYVNDATLGRPAKEADNELLNMQLKRHIRDLEVEKEN